MEKVIKKLKIDRTIIGTSFFKGGLIQAKKRLKQFIKNNLPEYNNKKNDPSFQCISNMSPYLHFGQISPLYIAQEILKLFILTN